MMNELDHLKCLICCDKANFKFKACNHEFCAQCLCKYLKTFSNAKIKCPSEHCTAPIPDNIIRKCLSNVQIEIYDKLCFPSNAVKCLVGGCTYFAASDRQYGHFICQFCKQPNCIRCSNLHPEDESCGSSSNRKLYEEKGRANLVEKRRQDLLELRKESCLDFNPEISECLSCLEFLLPREGIIIIPCLHNFCRKCLQRHLEEAKNIHKLTCLNCDVPLENGQVVELIGADRVCKLNIQKVEGLFYHCRTPDCTMFWDKGHCTTILSCPNCHKVNCIPCNAVHEGISCDDFKKSKAYKAAQQDLKVIKNAISCYNCSTLMIQRDGCGALKCGKCSKQVCAFTGKALGPKGCNCRLSQRCHKDCYKGCRPEGKSEEEMELEKYFIDN